MIRAFIAIRPPEEQIAALARRQSLLKKALPDPGIRWTRPEQNHLTLRFLGDIEEPSVEDLVEALNRACRTRAPFAIQARPLGCFPNARLPRVLWIGIADGLEALLDLQRAIQTETVAWGELEDRSYHPHLTLARVRQPTPRVGEAIQKAIAGLDLEQDPFPEWRINAVDLMRSELLPHGSRHTCLAQVALAAP